MLGKRTRAYREKQHLYLQRGAPLLVMEYGELRIEEKIYCLNVKGNLCQ